MPQLSVVIPAFNAADTLPELLASLATQRGAAIEVIVVDDASSDGTPQLAAAYPWVRWLTQADNRGVGATRNAGAATAIGEVLLFLDADTVATPDLLARVIAFFGAHPDIDAASGRYLDRNPGSERRRFARYLDVSEAAMRQGGLDGAAPGTLSGSLCAIRRPVFQRLGGFCEDRSLAVEDIELGLRLSRAGYVHWLVDDWQVGHRQPGLAGYLRELVPRTRNYLALLQHYRVFNEMMGGAGEGRARLALVGAFFAMFALPLLAWPFGMALAAAATGIAGWLNRRLISRLVAHEGWAFVVPGLAFQLLTSLAICAGGLLGVIDIVRQNLQRQLIDLAVLVAYLKSLLQPSAVGYLILYLTHRCNARCGHCFDYPQRAAIDKDQELGLDEIRRLAASAGPLGHLSLTGGEPLLRDDLPEVFAAWYASGVRSISLSTNGGYPEKLASAIPAMLAAAPAARLIVTLSVDALGARHDELRGCPGLFARVEESLSRLQSLRLQWPQLRLHACLTLSSANPADADAGIAWLQRWRFDQIELNALRGEPEARALTAPAAGDYDRIRERVRQANGQAAGLARLFAGLDRLMFRVVRNWRAPWPCGPCLAGKRLAVIHADGTVLPCEMLRSMRPRDAVTFDHFVLGRLADEDWQLGRIMRGQRAGALQNYIRDSACRCSFECAIFATISYRPWRLWRTFRRETPAGKPRKIIVIKS
jgi:glycosyltransferase involved in cell wall biosynthesis/MoaA/NifB/PqqE/SkfB family radical SAM enzyme